ncbi:hypothetical protein DQ783_16395 [Salmonella enterica subsp. enterica serovar Newport]|nr:hypothetical protein [Salmonella enterica]EBS2908529.1 hypothetical protein [Salmonella enterica subsp. enterica serovar Flottbek]EBS4086078.1 hypothetical protein [Salmonella enterica subsp. enterica serovar Newport]ECC9721131.1 hypothetical protein [Salmonella enterica subsp. diarizonae]EBI4884258.1 hypothetical protein [Salmonella enterica]
MRSSCPGGVGLDDWTAPAGQEPKGAIIPRPPEETGNRNRNRNRNRQRIITGRKKKPCTGQTKHLTGMQKIRRTTERTIRSSVIF